MAIPRLITKTDKESRDKKRRNLMTIFVSIILLASIAGFSLDWGGGNEEIKYNGFKFVQTEAGWKTNANGYDIQTTLLPGDVENISLQGVASLNDFGGKIYYIAKSWNMPALQELSLVINAEQFQQACLPEEGNETGCADSPLKNCDDASSSSPVIIFKDANETSAEYSNYCLVLNTDLNDSTSSIKIVDRVIFALYGIL